MIVADAKKFNEYITKLLKNHRKQIGRLVKKYVEIFWEQERKVKKYSEKEFNRVSDLLEYYEGKINGKDYNDIKEKIPQLLLYKAKYEILLSLKNE